MADSVAARVKRGVEVLDMARPKWRDEIWVGILRIEDCHHCVLGQIYGSYAAGKDKLFGVRVVDLTEFGFAPKDREYRALKDAWIKEINDGREG